MEYKKIEEINKLLKTTDVKGKDYVEVSERIKGFWMLYPNGKITTEIINQMEITKKNGQNGLMIIIKANIYDDNKDLISTGMACEKEGSSFINDTSFLENCETSAVGRALGFLGIGSDTDIASANEIINQSYQEDANKKISAKLVTCLNKSIENNNISDYVVQKVLNDFGYKDIKEIIAKDYMTVVNEIKKMGGIE